MCHTCYTEFDGDEFEILEEVNEENDAVSLSSLNPVDFQSALQDVETQSDTPEKVALGENKCKKIITEEVEPGDIIEINNQFRWGVLERKKEDVKDVSRGEDIIYPMIEVSGGGRGGGLMHPEDSDEYIEVVYTDLDEEEVEREAVERIGIVGHTDSLSDVRS